MLYLLFCQENALYLWIVTAKINLLSIFLWWSYPLDSSYTLKVIVFFGTLQCFFSGCIFYHLIQMFCFVLFFSRWCGIHFTSHFYKMLLQIIASYINFDYLNSIYGFEYYITWELFKILDQKYFQTFKRASNRIILRQV